MILKNLMDTPPGPLLEEYLLIPHSDITINFGEDDYGEYGLSRSSLEWCISEESIRDLKTFDDHRFDEGLELEFSPYRGLKSKEITINDKNIVMPELAKIEQEPLRLPDFSYVKGNKTLIVSDKFFNLLSLSKKTGSGSGKAILTDAFGTKHDGFHYISFHNPLSVIQLEKRLNRVEVSQRPFIYLSYKKHFFDNQWLDQETVLIHKDHLERFHQEGITGLYPEFYQKKEDEDGVLQHEIKEIYITYKSLENWQSNTYEIYMPGN
ncbi:hypothetical protein [Aquimarina pacifica]|uniref:hypothetical protein n=1 Tax=Aquimarina pacifica TaxID=1296415 RepID=UPI00046EC517|nr:hypothetical protein [Aquimarina pacifica]